METPILDKLFQNYGQDITSNKKQFIAWKRNGIIEDTQAEISGQPHQNLRNLMRMLILLEIGEEPEDDV
jgi:hypothetical protein